MKSIHFYFACLQPTLPPWAADLKYYTIEERAIWFFIQSSESRFLWAELHIRHKDYKEFRKLASHPVKNGIATFISFFVVGFIPLLSFIVAAVIPSLKQSQFIYSFVLTAMALLTIGAIKGVIVKKHPFRSSVETFFIGGIAALLAFISGYAIRSITG